MPQKRHDQLASIPSLDYWPKGFGIAAQVGIEEADMACRLGFGRLTQQGGLQTVRLQLAAPAAARGSDLSQFQAQKVPA